LLRPAAANAVVVDADWAALVAAYESRRQRPLLAELVKPLTAARAKPGAAAAPRGTALPEIEAAPQSERRDIVTNHVLREAARVLRVGADELEPAQGLFDLGIDSLMSVELKSRLEVIFDRKLPATLTFNYPSVSAIAMFIAAELGIEAAAAPAPHFEPDRRTVATPEPAAAGRDLDDLSESELAALLTGRLADL
jgi:acyl carrier protein